MHQEEKDTKPISVFMLCMINVAAICSIKNWPLTAEYGFTSLFYYLVAAFGFFIPVSLVSAELASAWPRQGGIYAWVKEALGHRVGFLAIWLQWIENVIYFPTVLSFIAATIAHVTDPILAYNKIYIFFTVSGVFWIATLVNFKGMQISGWLSTFGVIFGTIIPGALIILLGLVWYFSGRPIEINMDWQSFIPKNLGSFTELSLLAGVILSFAGMEMSAAHVKDVAKPKKNFPRAIFLSLLIILALSVLGTLSIAFIIPKNKISLVSSGLEAIQYFLSAYGIGWAGPLVSILITLGAFTTISTWVIGTSRGLLAAAKDGDLPPFLHKVNKYEMPVSMLTVQAVMVTVLSFLFLFMPTISSSFWMLLVLATMLYIIMYVLMFISGIVLRYKRPDLVRKYKIPGGNYGMWIVSSIGILVCLFAFFLSFYPPAQLVLGSLAFYESFLLVGLLVFVGFPFLILLFQKSSWYKDQEELEEENRAIEKGQRSQETNR